METISKLNNHSLNAIIVQKQSAFDTQTGQSFGSMLNDSQFKNQNKENKETEALKSHRTSLENIAKLNRLIIDSAA